MRPLIFAIASLFVAAPVWAQDARQETDRAEQELRSSLAPAGVAVDRVAPDEIRLTMADAITFEFNRAYVNPKFLPHLRDLARTLNAHPSMAVAVVGHTDAIGSDAYNQELSERRADAVGEALRDFSVPYRRIVESGMGEMQPVASNATDEGRARNRRVEITLKTKGGPLPD